MAREARELQQREERQRRELERQKKRELARGKAKTILLEHLDGSQREEYEKHQRFTVISRDGKRVYQIKQGYQHNVFLLNPEGKPIREYCGHLRGGYEIPHEDHMLAQKLMLESGAEEEFLKVANVRRLA